VKEPEHSCGTSARTYWARNCQPRKMHIERQQQWFKPPTLSRSFSYSLQWS
jgi:hypothetical protein